jgi:predicted N-formylglutamate amidohydrolase
MSPKPPADWPAPIEIINESGANDIVLICEHASNHIPAEYASLGLEAAHLTRHIAWDIGAAAVTRALATKLDAPAFLGTYSRLLIDLNRPPGVPSSIPERSESTDIPGNFGLSSAERERRRELIFAPYHSRIAEHLTARERAGRNSRLVLIHSFTPVFFAEKRPWHAGVLYDSSQAFAEEIIARLSRENHLNVAANVPYVISRDGDYAILVHGQDRGYPAILIEVRQDLLVDGSGIAEWPERLARAL